MEAPDDDDALRPPPEPARHAPPRRRAGPGRRHRPDRLLPAGPSPRAGGRPGVGRGPGRVRRDRRGHSTPSLPGRVRRRRPIPRRVPRRHAVPAAGLGGAADDPARDDRHVRRAGGPHRHAGRGPRRRARPWPATRSRSSCRATASSAPTGRSPGTPAASSASARSWPSRACGQEAGLHSGGPAAGGARLRPDCGPRALRRLAARGRTAGRRGRGSGRGPGRSCASRAGRARLRAGSSRRGARGGPAAARGAGRPAAAPSSSAPARRTRLHQTSRWRSKTNFSSSGPRAAKSSRRKASQLELDRVDVRAGRVLEAPQVGRDEAEAAGDRDGRVGERPLERGQRVAGRLDRRVGEDDDRAARPGAGRRCGPRRGRAARSSRRPRGRRPAIGVEVRRARRPGAPPARATARSPRSTTCVPAGRVRAQAREHPGEVVGPVVGDELDREAGRRRLVEDGRDGGRGAVADDARRPRSSAAPPAPGGRRCRGRPPSSRRPRSPRGGRRRGPVAGGAGRGALAGEADDLVGRLGAGAGSPAECSRDHRQDDADPRAARREVLGDRVAAVRPGQLADDREAEPGARPGAGRVAPERALERRARAPGGKPGPSSETDEDRSPDARPAGDPARPHRGAGAGRRTPGSTGAQGVLDEVGEDPLDREPVGGEGAARRRPPRSALTPAALGAGGERSAPASRGSSPASSCSGRRSRLAGPVERAELVDQALEAGRLVRDRAGRRGAASPSPCRPRAPRRTRRSP